MFDMFDLRDLFLAFRDWEPGESFWRTLAIYMGVTAACGVAGALAWAVWR